MDWQPGVIVESFFKSGDGLAISDMVNPPFPISTKLALGYNHRCGLGNGGFASVKNRRDGCKQANEQIQAKTCKCTHPTLLRCRTSPRSFHRNKTRRKNSGKYGGIFITPAVVGRRIRCEMSADSVIRSENAET